MKHRLSPLLALPLLLACSEKVVQLEEVTSTTLGVEGGRATSAAGELNLNFQPGVLPANTTVRIRTERGRHPLAGTHTLAIYELSTEPAIERFSAPVELVLDVSRAKSGRYVIANFDGPSPAVLATTKVGTQQLRAELAHFSSYGAWPDPNTSECPTETPASSDSCSVEDLRCEYGQECCCGQCYPALVATCSGGSWALLNTDACLGAALSCADAGVDPNADAAIEPELDGGGCQGLLCDDAGVDPNADAAIEPEFDGGDCQGVLCSDAGVDPNADAAIEPETDGGGECQGLLCSDSGTVPDAGS